MAVNLSPVGGVAAQFFTNTGAVLTGGKIYTYAAGTTTPTTTFTSSQGNVAWTNPIVLDAAGRVSGSGEIWLTDGISYKFVLKDSNDVLIATYDNITGINSNAISFTNQQQIITATANQTVFNLSISYQPATNSLSVFVDGVNQYGPGAQYAYLETDSDTVTFVTGLHVGAEVKFTTTQQQGAGAVNASQVTYDPAGTGAVTTNVQAKLRQTVSVADFGAVGDGVTDDTDAIQDAINEVNAAGGGIVNFAAGTFLVTDTIDILSDVILTGCGIGVTIIKMDSASTADYVIHGVSQDNVRIENLSVDVNGLARAANPTPMTGVRIEQSTNAVLEDMEVYGSLGSTSASAVGAALAQVTRGMIINSIARDCGSLTRGSDGFYCGPNEQTIIQGSIANNCTDTAFVLESCNYSGIVGCTSKGCRQGAAISAAFNSDCFGNFIDGLTVYNWSSAVAGGIPIFTAGTGSLRHIRVSNVTMIRDSGVGPAIQIYNDSASTAVLENITLSNILIQGAGQQGILVSGEAGRLTKNVTISECQIFGTFGANVIQIDDFCSDVQVSNCFLSPTATTPSVAILFQNAIRSTVQNCRIVGDSSTITYGVYFNGTNNNCAVLSSTITGSTVNTVGAITIGTIQLSLWVNDGSTGRLQIGASTVLRERLAAVSVVTGTAGASYGGTEQAMLNDLKTAVNAIIARLNSSTGHGLIT